MINFIDLSSWKTKRQIIFKLASQGIYIDERTWRLEVEKHNRKFYNHEVNTFIAHSSKGYKLTSDVEEIKDSHKEHANVSNGYKVDIKKLIKLYSEGKKQSEIAKILNCTQPAILYQIKKLKEKGEI